MPSPTRHHTHAVQVGQITLGGGAPVRVQSMTDTDTADKQATVSQILSLSEAGSEMVRITVNHAEAAKQVPYIRDAVRAAGRCVPLVGDFHYNGHELLTRYPACAEALDKYRINPGNVGFSGKRDPQFATMIAQALCYNKPVRIGVNGGSVDKAILAKQMDRNAKLVKPKSAKAVMQQALVQSALESAAFAQSEGMPANKIILSCKVSDVQMLIAVYRELAKNCHFALHLGLTEAGMGTRGIVASSIAMGILLQAGIGDTIRSSLTPRPGESRTQEVIVSQHILQTLGIRAFTPSVTACPGCGRTSSVFFRELAAQITQFLQKRMQTWRVQYPGAENLSVAVMGCIVNGPGESKQAHVGISLPGTGEDPAAPVFIAGKKACTLRGDHIAEEFMQILDDYVATKNWQEIT